jgi:LexA DNA binding domain
MQTNTICEISEGELCECRKREWDRILDNLAIYLNTPEGIDTLEQMQRIFSKVQVKSEQEALSLTDREIKAFRFIKKQVEIGKSPSVREIARAVNLKSSRSGARMVDNLVAKGVLKKITKSITLR